MMERETRPKSHDQAAPATALFLCFVRLPLLAIGFTIASLVIMASNTGMTFGTAWAQAANHSYVVVSIAADLPCFLLLAWAMRREGGKLRDLFRDSPQARWRKVAQGLMVFAIMAVPFGVLPMFTTWLVGAPPYPAGLTTPPLWVAAWTVLIFPFTTATAEELVYRAYALPRLSAALGTTVSVCTSAIGFGATHMLIPPLGTPETLLARFLTLALIGVMLELIYLRTGRIVPLIIGHLLIDMLLIGGFAMNAAMG